MEIEDVVVSVWKQALLARQTRLVFVKQLRTPNTRVFHFASQGRLELADPRDLTTMPRDEFWLSYTAGRCTLMNLSVMLVLDALLERGLKITHHKFPNLRLHSVSMANLHFRLVQEIVWNIDGREIRPQHPKCQRFDCDDWDHWGHTVCSTAWVSDEDNLEYFILDLTATQFGHWQYARCPSPKDENNRVPCALFTTADVAFYDPRTPQQVRAWLTRAYNVEPGLCSEISMLSENATSEHLRK